jgi:membrane protein DedA with SNARE-associated domain
MNESIQFLITYGGLVLFVVGFAEQSGLPFPGVPFLLAAGALAANGKFDLIGGIAWTAAGCVLADAIWFFVGQRGKSRVFRMFPHLRAAQVKLERATLARTILQGMRMLTAAKFLPFGTVIPVHAGALDVGRLRFLLVDAFTSLIYATVYAALGFAFHKQLEQAVEILRNLGAVSWLLIALLAGAYAVYWFLRHDRKIAAPEKSKADSR